MKVSNDPRVDKKIRSLQRKDSAQVASIIELFIKYGFKLPDLFLKKLTNNLWELRRGKWRLLFGLVRGEAIIVNIFLKKTQRTLIKEIELAKKRLREYL